MKFFLLIFPALILLSVVHSDTQAQQNCHPSYPTVCIPAPPPDLDCGDIDYRDFIVLPPDPHNFDGFDGTGDGIGCETLPQK